MESSFKRHEAVERWIVDDSHVKEELKRLLSVGKNPKLVQDQYDMRKKGLEKFPPPSPPNTSPKKHPTDPFIFWVYTENGVTIKIQAFYRLWDKTCYITMVSIAGL
jgi:hypothetical protein